MSDYHPEPEVEEFQCQMEAARKAAEVLGQVHHVLPEEVKKFETKILPPGLSDDWRPDPPEMTVRKSEGVGGAPNFNLEVK